MGVTKELASWDRIKELGFEEATGALPEKSKVKELEEKVKQEYEKNQNKILMQSQALSGGYRVLPGYATSFQNEYLPGAPIRMNDRTQLENITWHDGRGYGAYVR